MWLRRTVLRACRQRLCGSLLSPGSVKLLRRFSRSCSGRSGLVGHRGYGPRPCPSRTLQRLSAKPAGSTAGRGQDTDPAAAGHRWLGGRGVHRVTLHVHGVASCSGRAATQNAIAKAASLSEHCPMWNFLASLARTSSPGKDHLHRHLWGTKDSLSSRTSSTTPGQAPGQRESNGTPNGGPARSRNPRR